jgi:hypothetical protein
MKCSKCKLGQGILTCKECGCLLCTRCIQLEMHGCTGLENKKKKERILLEKNLVKVTSSKLVKL